MAKTHSVVSRRSEQDCVSRDAFQGHADATPRFSDALWMLLPCRRAGCPAGALVPAHRSGRVWHAMKLDIGGFGINAGSTVVF